MGIYKRGHIWWVSYQDMSGKQRRESSTSSNKRYAERLLDKRRGEVVERRLGLPLSHTPLLSTFAQDFLENVAHERTKDRYQDSVNALVAFFGNIRIGDITPEAITQFQQDRLKQGRKGATINRDVSVLSVMLNKARKLRFIVQNPCRDVDSFNESRGRRQAQPLSFEEEERLLANCDAMLRVFAVLLIETGLRPRKEAATLRWEDVDLYSEHPSLLVIASKTSSGIRRIPLSKRLVAELTEWRAVLRPDWSPFVFPSPRHAGKQWSVYQDSWERAIGKAKLPGRRVYDLRSTFATRAHAVYPNNLAIARLLGHSSPVILSTYAKSCESIDYEVIERMEALRAAHTTSAPIQ